MGTQPTHYTATKLETVEQVQALPPGAIATRTKRYESTWDSYDVYDVAINDDGIWIATPPEGYVHAHDLIGWTALTPINTQDAA